MFLHLKTRLSKKDPVLELNVKSQGLLVKNKNQNSGSVLHYWK